MSGPNTPSTGQSQTNVDEKHVDLRELGNMAEGLEADAIERATAISQATFPFDRLPRDIITEIFWNCLVHERETVWMSSGNAPLLLCCVCSSWRALALAMPQLWANVGILLRHPDDVDPSICAHTTNTWLERSGILPLTLAIDYEKIDYRARSPTTKPTVLDAVVSVVCSYSSRWQNVDITTWLPVSFPQLEILPFLRSFHLQGFYFSPEHNVISLPFSGSPRLTQLSWPYPFDPPTDTQIPWSQISHLCLDCRMTFFAALDTIRLCPQLENFKTNLIAEDRGDPLPTTVQNRCLRTLKIFSPADCGPFLDSLILPMLREFSLSTYGIGGREAFSAFLTRSNCKLYKLELRHCAFEPFTECLEQESFKSIQELKISFSPKFSDDELIRLTVSPSPAPRVLLPQLTHLRLGWCLHASKGMLAEMVLSRRRQRDGHETELLQRLHVMDDQLYEMDIRPIEDAIAGEFNAGFDMKCLINKNGERITIRHWEAFEAFDG